MGISEACIEETGQEEYIIKQLPLHHPEQVEGRWRGLGKEETEEKGERGESRD